MLASGGGLRGAGLAAIFDRAGGRGRNRVLRAESEGQILELRIDGHDAVTVRWFRGRDVMISLPVLRHVVDVVVVVEDGIEGAVLALDDGSELQIQVRPSIGLFWQHDAEIELSGSPLRRGVAAAV